MLPIVADHAVKVIYMPAWMQLFVHVCNVHFLRSTQVLKGIAAKAVMLLGRSLKAALLLHASACNVPCVLQSQALLEKPAPPSSPSLQL